VFVGFETAVLNSESGFPVVLYILDEPEVKYRRTSAPAELRELGLPVSPVFLVCNPCFQTARRTSEMVQTLFFFFAWDLVCLAFPEVLVIQVDLDNLYQQ